MLKAKLYLKNKLIELFENQQLIHTETLDNLEDYWFELRFKGEIYDFNLWEEDGKYRLTKYPTYQNIELGVPNSVNDEMEDEWEVINLEICR